MFNLLLSIVSVNNRPSGSKRLFVLLVWGLLNSLLLSACADDALTNPPLKPEVLKAYQSEPATNSGNSNQGALVFSRLPCASCHSLVEGGPVTEGAGPSLAHLSLNAATRIPGTNAPQYIRHVLRQPQDLHLPGYRPIMPELTGSLTAQELDDLIAFLLTLK